MGYASHLIADVAYSSPLLTVSTLSKTRISLLLYISQLGLNLAFTPLFFKSRKPQLALLDTVALVANVAVVAGLWYPINPTATWLMIPYLAWCTYASALNWNIVDNNSKDKFQ